MSRPPRMRRLIVGRVSTDQGKECWEWPGATNDGGRPVISSYSIPRYAYQVAYELRYGPVPKGLELHHTCWNKWCWNPDHVKPVTRQDNALSGPVLNWESCPHGHPMIGENVQVYVRHSRPHADGSLGTYRVCRTCHRKNSIDYQASRRI